MIAAFERPLFSAIIKAQERVNYSVANCLLAARRRAIRSIDT
jgi:hypothetical protein